MKAYSIDLRERAVAACEAGTATQPEVAKRFGVSLAWVKNLLRLKRDTGSIAPRPHGGGRKAAFEGESLERLNSAIQEKPDATLQELLETTQVEASIMAVQRALKRLGYRRKKSHYVPANKIVRMSRHGAKSGKHKQEN